ncbi:MAG TPA: EAL domain-containing protein [Solirubrobacterales bacterium]|nr:EAL domain-containing protein [Solirubrobacterales bacterium]
MLAGLLAASLAAAALTGVELRSVGARSHTDVTFFLPLLAAAVACAAAVFWHREERLGWGVLAVALALGAAAEAAFPLPHQEGDQMPLGAGIAYGVFCVAGGATLLALSGNLRLRRASNQGLWICVFGLATIWTWLFLAPGGSTGDVVYGALDLLLALLVLTALCNHGWPVSPRFGMLAGGFGLIVLADSMHVQGHLAGVLGVDLADLLPFAAAALIAAVACMGVRPPEERARSGRLVVILSLLSVLLAVATLVYDHYSRLSAGTVLLASATLLFAGIRLVLAQRGWRDARARARQAEVTVAVEAAGFDAAIAVGPDGRIVSCNERARQVFRRDEIEIVGKPVDGLLEGGDRPVDELFADADAGALPASVELNAYDTHGVGTPVEVAIGALREGSEVRTLVVRDISERRRREEENRRLAAIIRSSEDAVLTKDLTGVVTGWNQGAERLYGYSAEEAIGMTVEELIIPGERREEAQRVLDEVGAGETISFETQRRTKDGTTMDVTLRAFPIRGLTGEVTAVCTVAHDVSERRRRERAEEQESEALLWRGHLRQALGGGDLVFHGQPILDLKSGQVHHHELLVRMWLEGDLVLPGSFLPHAEATELIRDLDLWAVEQGIRVAAQIPVAVNLSARSLGSRDLLRAVEKRLGEEGPPARNLTFEITETAAAENMEGARELVRELTQMGCGVALDDFGTGYGSFTYLRHLPVTQLKIDSEFITGIGADTADRRVVESMVAVARNFEMTTVAEGVEDRATFERLEELGVDLVQGYYVGRPRPLELGREAIHG